MSPIAFPRAVALATPLVGVLVATLLSAAPVSAQEAALGSISGAVIAPNGEPAVGECVTLRSATGEEVLAGPVSVDESGVYVFPGVQDGAYTIRTDACLDDVLQTWYPSAGDVPVAPDGVVTVVGGPIAGVDVTLLPESIDATTAPAIEGAPIVGSDLIATVGEWSVGGLEHSFSWSRDGVPIDGATTASYRATAADIGSAITVVVTAFREGWGSTSASSEPIGPIVSGTLELPIPVVAGAAVVGRDLRASLDGWNAEAIRWQWARDGVAIEGATAGVHRVTAADLGARLTVTATVQEPGGSGANSTSAPTAVVVAGVVAPTPAVTGFPRVGNVLTSLAGTWAPEDVELAYAWRRNGALIPGAASATYRLTAADLGARITVSVTGSLPDIVPVTRTSAPTAIVVPGILTSAPLTVSGTAVVGRTLTAHTGSWGPEGVAFFITWKRSGVTIPYATGPTYVVKPGDYGHRISYQILAVLPGYKSVVRLSATTGPAQLGSFAAPTPTLSGTAGVGQLLTITPDSWTPSAKLSFSWRRDGVAIPGATASTYRIQAADVSKRITAVVTGAAAGYVTTTRATAPSDVVTPGVLTTAQPSIAGTAAVGQLLTAVPGAWGPAGVRNGFSWWRDEEMISGAFASTYRLTAEDEGRRISVRVGGALAGYVGQQRVSSQTAPVVEGALVAPVPVVTGGTTVGRVLTATAGAWGPSGVALAYQWNRNGLPVPGATGVTYRLVAADVGAIMTVTVTGSRPGYATAVKTSRAIPAISAGQFTLAVTLSGTARSGSVLTATPSVSPTGTLEYQWYRTTNGNSTAIAGATARTYTVKNVDVGSTLLVRVTVRAPGFVAKSVDARTAVVVMRPFAIVANGTYRVGAQIAPGTYFTYGTQSTYCYWERLSDARGSFDSIIANDLGYGRRMVTISSSDQYFRSSGCGAWYRWDGTGRPAAGSPGNGIFAVGADIRPGVYTSSTTQGLCYVAGLSGAGATFDEIIENELFQAGEGPRVWEILPEDRFFETSGCGNWTRVG